jgi:hypothetical protein
VINRLDASNIARLLRPSAIPKDSKGALWLSKRCPKGSSHVERTSDSLRGSQAALVLLASVFISHWLSG